MKVTYLDHMGSDLTVVNAARVSFGKASKWGKSELLDVMNGELWSHTLKPEDSKLITYLARGYSTGDLDQLSIDIAELFFDFAADRLEQPPIEWTIAAVKDLLDRDPHWSPFSHPQIQLHVKAPIFVARQLQKHTVGCAWNEVSRRYVDSKPEFYWPDKWRFKADSVKQGSAEDGHDRCYFNNNNCVNVFQDFCGEYSVDLDVQELIDYLVDIYKKASKEYAPEQLRMILPQNMYTEWYWTGSLYYFARVCKQRLDRHAQKETQMVAEQISDIVSPLFPVSWKALTDG